MALFPAAMIFNAGECCNLKPELYISCRFYKTWSYAVDTQNQV